MRVRRRLATGLLTAVLWTAGGGPSAWAADVQAETGWPRRAAERRVALPPAPGMTRAELTVWNHAPTGTPPKAVLILCPGANGDGGGLPGERAWRLFLETHGLLGVGLSFASPPEALRDGRGYYYPGQGSGGLLIEGVRRALAQSGIPDASASPLPPLYLFGFSGGAHFAARFAAWRPDLVAGWCAHSAAWWDAIAPESAARLPPGLVACGRADPRVGESFAYFARARAGGAPLAWAGLPGTDHRRCPRLERFFRSWMAALLDGGGLARRPVQVDARSGDVRRDAADSLQARLISWLPDRRLQPQYRDLITTR